MDIAAGLSPSMHLFADVRILVCILGPGRAVLARRGRPIPMSRDHKPLAPSEVARITHAGGFVFRNRVMGRLGVARAIGDAALKTGRKGLPLVTAEPEVRFVAVWLLDCAFFTKRLLLFCQPRPPSSAYFSSSPCAACCLV